MAQLPLFWKLLVWLTYAYVYKLAYWKLIKNQTFVIDSN